MHKTRGRVIPHKFNKGCFSIAGKIKWKERKKDFTKNYPLIMPPIMYINMLLICNTIAFQMFPEL